jgi:hypothetical protein
MLKETRYVGLMAAHPGDDWQQWCPMDGNRIPLPVEGLRCIFVAWPPIATCEICGQRPPENAGFVGPVAGDVVQYPDPNTRFFCETCVRSLLELGPDELTGHQCQGWCTDTEHVQIMVFGDELTSDQRIEQVTLEMGPLGWTVVGIESPAQGMPAPPAGFGGSRWAVWIRPTRSLPWPANR